MSEQPIKITGGRLKQFTSQWQCITSDPFILNSVENYKIEFENGEPMQFIVSASPNLNLAFYVLANTRYSSSIILKF